MKRRISYIISALVLSAVLAVVLRSVEFRTPKHTLSALLSELPAADSSPLRQTPAWLAETTSLQAAPTTTTPAPVSLMATPIREVRVRAVRDGRDYGWVQLPRGTRVGLVRDEGETLLIRFDQVTLRIPRVMAETGMVVPVSRQASRIAGL